MLFHALHLPTSWANAERVFKCNDAANKSLDVRARTATFIRRCPLNFSLREFGFAPRQLNRYALR